MFVHATRAAPDPRRPTRAAPARAARPRRPRSAAPARADPRRPPTPHRTPRAISIRRKSGGPPTARTETSPNPNSPRTSASELRV